MKLRTLFATLLTFGVLLVPATAGAEAVTFGHGGMYTSKYVDGANLILLTDNSHGTQSGTPVTYNIRLYDSVGQPVPFQTAKVTFEKGSDVIYSKDMPLSPDNDIVFTYTLARHGSYTLRVRFFDNGKEISKAHFPVVAAKGPRQGFFVDAFSVQTGLAFVLGAGTVYAYGRRRDFGPLKKRAQQWLAKSKKK